MPTTDDVKPTEQSPGATDDQREPERKPSTRPRRRRPVPPLTTASEEDPEERVPQTA